MNALVNDWVQQTNIRGRKGDKGDQGDPGPPNVLEVGTVTTVLPTQPADVEITGTSPAQEINFWIPQGPPGPGAAGINLGTGAEVFAGADPGTGIMEFWRVRGTDNADVSLDANGVIVAVVDGPGSGLDADLLDGQDGAWYRDWANLTGKPATFPPTLPIAQSGVTSLTSDLALKAPLASPALTGNPTAPTPATSDNDTSIATTAFTKAAIAAAGAVATVAASAPASPVLGQIWWHSTEKTLYIWSGTAWEPVLATWG
jgi:hypothetical protein